MRQPKSISPPVVTALALFFASGALALVYQVVWARLLTHVFGSTAIAVGTVLAAFMAGMAIGSWYLGRLADRAPNRLRLYAWLEIGIAASALLTHVLLWRLDALYPALHALAGGNSGGIAVLRFVVGFLAVSLPTMLMGATLPVLSRFLVSADETVGVSLGALYAVNTLGAVTGAAATGFVLIGEFGLHTPVVGAAVGNLLIGAIAWGVSADVADATIETPPAPAAAADSAGGNELGRPVVALLLAGLGISGFTSFAYEIYWTRSLVFVLGNSTYALTTMLCAFLTGIALGSYLVRFAIRRVVDRVILFGWIQVLLGLTSALALPLLFAIDDPVSASRFLLGISGRAVPLVLASLGVAFLVMLVPAALIGATFPLVGDLAVRRVSEAGATVGRVYAVNTIGNVLGAVLPGAALIAWLGIQKGIVLMASLNVALGLLVLSVGALRSARRPVWWVALPALLAVCAAVLTRAPLDFQFPSKGERPHHRTLYYREGPLATTKVYRDPVSGEKRMSVDGIVIGGTGNTHFKQLLLAHLPRLLKDETSRELSVGLGSGILVGESARHPGVESIIAVEIEPSVVEGAAYFAEENHGVLADPRLSVIGDDISSFLRTTERQFDVITADEKTADEFASNGFSYSLEYYEQLRDHLAPGGLVAQWVPATLPRRQYRMILRTFAEAFPRVQLWSFLPAHRLGPFNSVLIGSVEGVAIDVRAINRRLAENPEAFSGLEPYGITSAEALVPHFVADETVIRDAVADAELNTLDHPRYEFYQPWEYAKDRAAKAAENQAFLMALKREAHPAFIASLIEGAGGQERLEQSFAAEFTYLAAFQRFLAGVSMGEAYALFDNALAMAPWNDSIRARIYAQYRYFAATQRDPVRRVALERRAEELYAESPVRAPAGGD